MSRRLSDLLAAERHYLGVHESPAGSNRTSVGVEFGWNGVSWCAETQVVALRRAGFTEVPKNASAWGLGAALCNLRGWKKIAPANLKRGDIVVYTFSHIGFCETRTGSTTITAIEGNHNNACMRVPRSINLVKYGVRPPFAAGAVVASPKPPVVMPKPTPKPNLESLARLHYPKVVVVKGSSLRSSVRSIQAALNKKDKAKLTVDGVFGSNTETAVKEFQHKNHLTDDGKVGPATWTKLFA